MEKDYFTLNTYETEKKAVASSDTDYIKLGMILVTGLALAGKAVSAGYHLIMSKDGVELDPHDDDRR